MKQTRTAKRREAAINSVKILLTSVSLAATIGGWAVISTANGAALDVAQVNATATVQSFLDSRSTTTVNTAAGSAAASATSTSAASTNTVTNASNNTLATGNTGTAANSVAPTATAAPAATATAAPTQVVVQRVIRTHSSR